MSGPGPSLSQRLLAFEASTGVPHASVLLLAAPFAVVDAVRWLASKRRRADRAAKR